MDFKTGDEINSGIYQKGGLSFEEIYKSVKNHPLIKESGSILTFTGIVRRTSSNGEPIKKLKIEAYDELGNRTILEICEDIKNRYGLIDLKIIHLKGTFEISDDLVYVIVASAHREEGFKALKEAVEKYKKELPVWMKEEFSNGESKWV
ncbi:MAG: molybdenum cofactor biosynthesis protein MoaE [Promethearchaeota archaeon]|nr:MAG: molybdenum cofactor biosynthesis protein MoaE [Candidatus Lokiarchaeota archaeon]